MDFKALFNWIARFFSPNPKYYEQKSSKIRIKPEYVSISPEGTLSVEGYYRGAFVTACADTNSMDPMIDAGMFLIWEPIADVRDLQVGDVILWQAPGRPARICHRITSIYYALNEFYCYTKGDTCAYTDPYRIQKEWITGVLRGVLS